MKQNVWEDRSFRDLQNRGAFTRREMMTAGIGLAIGSAVGAPGRAVAADATAGSVQVPGFYRFRHGDVAVTVVSDGRVFSGDPKKSFLGGTSEEVDTLLSGYFLPTDKVILEENVVLVDVGGRSVLFDCGTGASTLFGTSGGQLAANLTSAGIDPTRIDAVVLSHGHPDHLGGLLDESGAMRFANARVFMNRTDHDFWVSEERIGTKLAPFRELAVAQLTAYRDHMTFVSDEEEFLPGVQAVFSPGHTIGHTHFLVASGGQPFAITADLTRHHVLGVETRWQFAGDFDPALSVETREKHFSRFADEKIPLLSYHYPWPGHGHIVRYDGGFRYIPTAMDLT